MNFHQRLYLKNLTITAILLAALSGLAFITYRYNAEFDSTANSGNTLSAESQKVLASLQHEVMITVYLKTSHPLKRQIKPLLERYRRLKPTIKIQFVDPELNLAKARELNIGSQGLIVVEYQGRSEKISFLDESTLTNALLQLANTKERWASFLTGHGERSATGVANFDLSSFAKELQRRNIKAQPLNLAEVGGIPDNSTVLVLAAPRVPLLAGELQIIQNYIQQGGNLLLLTDPEDQELMVVEQQLGLQKSATPVRDDSARVYGIDNPLFVLMTQYNRHPVTQSMENITVYPGAAALTVTQKTEFAATPILKKDTHVIGYALTRNLKNKPEQRIVVIGDGDFLSNTFLGNVGNREMGMRIFNWLTHDDEFVEIPLIQAKGKSLQLSPLAIGVIGFGFLLILPLGLIVTGFWIWRRRKRR